MSFWKPGQSAPPKTPSSTLGNNAKPPAPAPAPAPAKVVPNTNPVSVVTNPSFPVGTVVEANYRTEGSWYRGTITSYGTLTNKYSVLYDDGDKEDHILPENVRVVTSTISPTAAASSSNAVSPYKVGDSVEARVNERSPYRLGKVTRVRLNNSVDVTFDDDGSQEAGIKTVNLRFPEVSAPASEPRKPSPRSNPAPISASAPAVPSAPPLDEDTELTVRIVSIAASDLQSDSLFGDKIDPYVTVHFDAFNGRTRAAENTAAHTWRNLTLQFSSSVKKLRSTQLTFSVYDENMLKRDELTGKVGALLPIDAPELCGPLGFGQGQVDYSMTVELLSSKDRPAGTLMVGFNVSLKSADATTSHSTAPASAPAPAPAPARAPAPAPAPAPAAKHYEPQYAVGTVVEGNYRGQGYWYGGKVSAFDRTTGLYSVVYDDGDRDEGISVEWVRLPTAVQAAPIQQSNPAVSSSIFVETPASAAVANSNNSNSVDVVASSNVPFDKFDFSIGDKVDANYRNKGTYFSGVITAIDENGLYSIEYDDGEVERSVHGSKIRFHVDSPRGEFSYGGVANSGVGSLAGSNVPSPTPLNEEPNINYGYGFADESARGYENGSNTFANPLGNSSQENLMDLLNAGEDEVNALVYGGLGIGSLGMGGSAEVVGSVGSPLGDQGSTEWLQSSKYNNLNLYAPPILPTERLETVNSATKEKQSANDGDEYGDDFD
jgi:hypothetical protein